MAKIFMCPKCGKTITVSNENKDLFACGECKVPMKELKKEKG